MSSTFRQKKYGIYLICSLLCAQVKKNSSYLIETTKIPIFCDISPCSSLKVDRRFGGTCYPNFEYRSVRNRHELGRKHSPEDGGDMLL
jgi:hypothetical protein